MPEHCRVFIKQFCFGLVCDLSEGPAPVPEGYCLSNNTDVHIPTSNVKGEAGCSRGCTDSKEIIKSHWSAETKLYSKRKTNNRQEATGNQARLRKAALEGIAQFPLTNSYHGPDFRQQDRDFNSSSHTQPRCTDWCHLDLILFFSPKCSTVTPRPLEATANLHPLPVDGARISPAFLAPHQL